MEQGEYPETFYRVSIKARITDEQGRILVVRENENYFELPGGGMDHGETVHGCLKREMNEELAYIGGFTESFRELITFYLPERDAWKMNIVYDVKASGDASFEPGPDSRNVTWVTEYELEKMRADNGIVVIKD